MDLFGITIESGIEKDKTMPRSATTLQKGKRRT